MIKKNRYKEGEHCKIDAVPGGAGFLAWKNVTYQNINTCSVRPDDKALVWARELENDALPEAHFHLVPRCSGH